MTLTKLRKLRKINEITLDEVALDTGLSIGYINRIERGYITEIKNEVKRKRLENYIKGGRLPARIDITPDSAQGTPSVDKDDAPKQDKRNDYPNVPSRHDEKLQRNQ